MARSGFFAGILSLSLAIILVWSCGLTSPCEVLGDEQESLLNYMAFYRCAPIPHLLKVLVLFLWLLLLISLLATTADLFFVPQLDALSRDLNLAEDIAGVTLLAFGNGMPDVMTATSAIKNNDFALTMGEFLGAANFILGVVLGVVLLSTAGPTQVDSMAFQRDAGAYVFVIIFMVAVSWDATIHLIEALSFFLLYAVYVAAVIWTSRRNGGYAAIVGDVEMASIHSKTHDDEIMRIGVAAWDTPRTLRARSPAYATSSLADPESKQLFMPVDCEPDADFDILESEGEERFDVAWEGIPSACNGRFLASLQLGAELPFTLARHLSIPSAAWDRQRRLLAMVSPAFGLHLIVLSFGGWNAFGHTGGPSGQLPILVLVGALIGVFVFVASKPHERPRWHPVLMIFAFSVSIAWFNLLATECVVVLETFGLNFGVSSSVLGATVLAWGNSVGDLVADTALARQSRSRTAVAAVFGSPMVSDLLGLGVALTSYTLQQGPLQVKMNLQNKVAVGFLSTSIVGTICTFALSGYSCPRSYAFVLIAWYILYIVASIWLETQL